MAVQKNLCTSAVIAILAINIELINSSVRMRGQIGWSNLLARTDSVRSEVPFDVSSHLPNDA